jgi:hypothetical protein
MTENKRNRKKDPQEPEGFFLQFVIGGDTWVVRQSAEACGTAVPPEQAPLHVLVTAALYSAGFSPEARAATRWSAMDGAGRVLDLGRSPEELGLARGDRVIVAPEEGGSPGGPGREASSSSAGPVSSAPPAEPGAAPPAGHAEDLVPAFTSVPPLWLEVSLLARQDAVATGLMALAFEPTSLGRALRPWKVQCDVCGSRSLIDTAEALDWLSQVANRTHTGCGGTWRPCYRLLLDKNGRAFLADPLEAPLPRAAGARHRWCQ